MDDQQIGKSKSDLTNLSVKDIFFKYARLIPVFIFSVAIALLGAYVYLRYATRIYSASGTMIINNERKSGSSGDRAEDILYGSASRNQNLQNEIQILRSVPLMTRVVNKLDLSFSYKAQGRIKDLNIYKQTPFKIEALQIADSNRSFTFSLRFLSKDRFRFNNEKDLSFGEVFKNSFGIFRIVRLFDPEVGPEYTATWMPAMKVAAELISDLKVQPAIAGTGILGISLQSTSPRMASDVVNTLMSEYDSMTIEQNNYSTDQMLGFIDTRLAILNGELDSAQQRLLEYQQKENLIDVDIQSSAFFTKITEADKDAEGKEMQLSVARLIEDYLGDKKNRFSRVVVPSSLGLDDVTLNRLVSNYNDLQLERQRLLDGNVPAENPRIKELEGAIEKLRESLIENVVNIKKSYTLEINALRNRAELSRSAVNTLPFKVKEYVELKRQVDVKLDLVKTLQGKREEAAISRASTISNSKVIEKATVPVSPVKPERRLIQLLAIAIGLALPALVVFIMEVLNDKVNTRNDIEKITETPILGEVGHSFNDKVLIVNKTSRSMVAEQFRILRSNLQYILSKTERPVIMVTSSFSGEGKSFVSTNMGAVLALTGKKTVILEFDIRKPKVLSGLNMSKKPGITNYLVGKGELDQLIIPVPETENLYVLPCGPIPPNPSEILLDNRVTEMFTYLKANFDVVIIDTAPVGMVSDAMTLGKFADCTIYLVRQEHTHKRQIALIDEFYREKKLPRISIVVNDVKMKAGYGYYGSGRYGYGYGYSSDNSYYEEESAPRTFLEKVIDTLDFRKWFKKK